MRSTRVPLQWLIRKILKTKTRGAGACLTFQEVLNIFLYGLAMSFSLVSLRNPIKVGLSPSPAPTPMPPASSQLLGCASGMSSTLLYAPNTVQNTAVITAAAALLTADAPACHVEGFAGPADLLASYTNSTTRQLAAVAAILFDDQPVNYTIAMARGKVSLADTGQRDFQWPDMAAYSVAFEGQNDGDTVWESSGFVGIQWAVDQAIMQVNGISNTTGLGESRFPLQPFASSYGSDAGLLRFLLPLFGVIAPMTTAFLLGQFMVIEKAYQLVDGLRMMGMRYSLYYISWFLVYGVIMLLSAAISTLGFSLTNFFPNSDLGLLFFHLLLSGLCFLPSSFLIVAVSKGGTNDPEKARNDFNGINFLIILFYIGGFAIVHFINAPLGAFVAVALIPQVACMIGVSIFVQAEEIGMGLGWSDLLWTNGDTVPPLLAIFGLMITIAIIMMFKAVSEASSGLKRVPMPKPTGGDHPAPLGADPPDASTSSTSDALLGLTEVVRITNLGRAFAAQPKPVVALSNFNLSLYEGQITTLLGQNGAGKSTCIGILNGLMPPSEGDAVIYGHPITSSMDAVRSFSGICPQHDLVFEGLTCTENVCLVGSQKGMTTEQMASGEVEKMLEAVGLDAEKFSATSATLSGGQKRKLSLACALIGGPKFVLLD